MTEEKLLYEGKAKQLFTTEDPNILRVKYKNSLTALNGKQIQSIDKKGELNNRISSMIFKFLSLKGIHHHFIQCISPTEQLVKNLTIIPLEVVVRNIATGSFVKRLGVMEGTLLPHPIIEFYYKNDELGDPLVNHSHIYFLELALEMQLKEMEKISLQVNSHLKDWFLEMNILLVDFKLEFGFDSNGQLLVADEISPDTCRFWDTITQTKLDKDRFRLGMGQVLGGYEEILNRLEGSYV